MNKVLVLVLVFLIALSVFSTGCDNRSAAQKELDDMTKSLNG